jgi:WD40 repeat protein
VAVHPNGRILATAGDDKAVHLWTLPDCNYLGSLLGHSTRIQSLEYCRDGAGLLTSSSDLSVRLWEVASSSEVRHLRSHRAMVWGAQVSCWPNLVVTVSADRWVRAFRLDSGLLVGQAEAHEGWARALAMDPQHPFFATGGGDGKIRLWRIPDCLAETTTRPEI